MCNAIAWSLPGAVALQMRGGGQMAMFAQPLHRVFLALELLRPTCILGVPALWIALQQEFEQEVATTTTISVSEARAAVAKRFGVRFGNRLEVVSSGTAPLPPQVREFMWSAFPKAFIGEGYGTQEVGLITLEEEIQKGVTVRLRDVEGYSMKDKPHPRGDALVQFVWSTSCGGRPVAGAGGG